VRVVQGSRHLRLGAEAAQEPGITREAAVEHLHRDPPTKAHVVGEEHPSARARTDGCEESVSTREDATDEVGDGSARHAASRLRAANPDTASCHDCGGDPGTT
jgi:hypothetical protein